MAQPDDVEAWREELLRVAVIVQDGDDSVGEDERVARFERFVAMLDALDGSESDRVLDTVLDAVTEQEDYGAYQALHGALRRFPPERLGRAIARDAPRLVREAPGVAWDVLLQVRPPVVAAFNAEAERLPADDLAAVRAYVREGEQPDGWMEDAPGELVPE